jgi:hypothetical protein
MRKITLIAGGLLIAWGAVGVLDALDIIHVSLCGLLWAFLFIAAGVWLIWGAMVKESTTESEEVSIPLEGAKEARISITHAAGRLAVGAGAGTDQLARGTFVGGLDYKVNRAGDVLDLNMRVQGQGLMVALLPWKWVKTRGAEWAVELNGGVPLDLKIEGGASENQLDLSGLQVKELEIETGASSTKLTLPASAGHTRAEISCGAGAVEVRVPAGVAARLRVHSTMAEVKVDRRRFPRVSSGLYESPDYETAQNRIELDVSASLGGFELR